MEIGYHNNFVFHDKQLILTVLRKNASGTVHRTLVRSLGHKGKISGADINRMLGSIPRFNKKQIANSDYMKAVIVRNPYKRLVSGWAHRICSKPPSYVKKTFGISKNISFEKFIDWVCKIPDNKLNVHFSQQTHAIALNGMLLHDHIIKLENIKVGWDDLRKLQPWLHKLAGHHHATKKRGYKEYYTDELIKKVEIRFANDLNLLEYNFEGSVS